MSCCDEGSRRILVIDDTESIHGDFRKILCREPSEAESLDAKAAALFGDPVPQTAFRGFDIESAYQGCVSVLQKSSDDTVKKAALGCLKKWNEPAKPLPKALPLPAGKKVPKGVTPE